MSLRMTKHQHFGYALNLAQTYSSKLLNHIISRIVPEDANDRWFLGFRSNTTTKGFRSHRHAYSNSRDHFIHVNFLRSLFGDCGIRQSQIANWAFFVALQTVTKRYPHHIPIIKTLYLQILLFKSQFVMGKSANPFYDLFPTCQVRVVRFYVSCLLLLPPPASSCLLPPPRPPCRPCRPRRPRPTATRDPQCSLPDLNHDHPRPVFPAGPQPRPATPSVPCRTSTTTSHAQCSLPDLICEYPCQVFPAGPQHAGIHAKCSLPDLM